jgi:hypothetical protein
MSYSGCIGRIANWQKTTTTTMCAQIRDDSLFALDIGTKEE